MMNISRVASFTRAANNRNQPITIVAGATGHVGKNLIVDLFKQKHKVVACYRHMDESISRTKGINDLTWHQVGDVTKEETWTKLLEEMPKNSNINIINCIGAPIAPKGKTLDEVNTAPAHAIASAMKKFSKKSESDLKLVLLSSLAAAMLQDDYGRTKRDAEEVTRAVGLDNQLTLRLSYVFEDLKEDKRFALTKTHAYGPEQLATLPFVPIIGSGNQNIQPVCMGDVVKATRNYLEIGRGAKVVNAVGTEVLTQVEFFKFYRDLTGKQFRPIYIPYPAAEFIAQNIPNGHIAPYAVEGCLKLDEENKTFDSKDFQDLLGSETTKLSDVLTDKDQLVFSYPPIFQHLKQLARVFCHNPKLIARAIGIPYQIFKNNIKK